MQRLFSFGSILEHKLQLAKYRAGYDDLSAKNILAKPNRR